MLSCLKRNFCCFAKRVKNPKQEVYVLKLQEDKYYVGESINVKKRIWAHRNDNGSAWTKKYGVESGIFFFINTYNLLHNFHNYFYWCLHQ